MRGNVALSVRRPINPGQEIQFKFKLKLKLGWKGRTDFPGQKQRVVWVRLLKRTARPSITEKRDRHGTGTAELE
jgi:hypothetical protein